MWMVPTTFLCGVTVVFVVCKPVSMLKSRQDKADAKVNFFGVRYYRQRTYVRREVMFSQVCVCSGGSPRFRSRCGGVPSLRFWGGSSQSQIFGGSTWSQIFGGGYLVSVKGKIFDTRFGLIHVFRLGKKIFVEGPPPVKGKIFDTRFGLIHIQTGKIFFVEGPPPPSKGKNFWHQIWLDTCADWEKKFLSRDPPLPVKGKVFDTLIHVQTGKNNFCRGTPPPTSKGKNFWHLDTCSDWKKIFLSRDPPPGIARNCYGYAAGGMPLAFTQEDFLVISLIFALVRYEWTLTRERLGTGEWRLTDVSTSQSLRQ